MIGIWINRFRIFANMANLTQDQALVVVIVTLALQNLLRFKSQKVLLIKFKGTNHRYKENETSS